MKFQTTFVVLAVGGLLTLTAQAQTKTIQVEKDVEGYCRNSASPKNPFKFNLDDKAKQLWLTKCSEVVNRNNSCTINPGEVEASALVKCRNTMSNALKAL